MHGPLPLEDASSIARQIAEALEAADDHGSAVHRDLKPANIKLRADGTVKVLDFGLTASTTWASEASATIRPRRVLRIGPAATPLEAASSTSVFHSPQSSHLPCQRDERPPQFWQEYWGLWRGGIQMLGEERRSVYTICSH